MGNVPAILHGDLPVDNKSKVNDLPTELQNSFEGLQVTLINNFTNAPYLTDITYLKEIPTLKKYDLENIPMFLRYKFDRERVPILHSVILIIIVISMMGSGTALFLNEAWEKAVLSLSYCLLLVAASMNQGLINRWWQTLDIVAANAIVMLNIYFWALTMEWYHWLIGGGFILYFLIYNMMFFTHTVRWYEIHTNIWHMGVILMIYLVPLQLEQKNLF